MKSVNNYLLALVSRCNCVVICLYRILLIIFLIFNLPNCFSQDTKVKFDIPEKYVTEYPDYTGQYSLEQDTSGFQSIVIIDQYAEIEHLWCQNLNDPLLDSLINVAVTDNYNLLILQQKIIQAR